MSAPTHKKKETLYSGLEDDFYTPGITGKLFLILAGVKPALVKNIPYEARMQRYFGGTFFVVITLAVLSHTYLGLALGIGFSNLFLGNVLIALLAIATLLFFRYINSTKFSIYTAASIALLLSFLFWLILTPLALSFQKNHLKAGIETFRSSQSDSIKSRFINDSAFLYGTDAEALKKKQDTLSVYINKISFLRNYIIDLDDSINLITHRADSLQAAFNKLSTDSASAKKINDQVKAIRKIIVQVNTANDSAKLQIRRVKDSLETLEVLYSKDPDNRFYIAQKNSLVSRQVQLENNTRQYQNSWRVYMKRIDSLETSLKYIISPNAIGLTISIKANNSLLSNLQTAEAAARIDLRRLEDTLQFESRIERLQTIISAKALERDSLLNRNQNMQANWILVARTTAFLVKNDPDFASKFVFQSILLALIMFFVFIFAITRKNYYRPVYEEYRRIQDEYTESKARSFLDIEELKQKNSSLNRDIELLKEENISDFIISAGIGNKPEDEYYISALKKEEYAKQTRNTSHYDPLIIDNALEDINKAISLAPARPEFWDLKSRLLFLNNETEEGNKAATRFRELRSEERFRSNIDKKIWIREVAVENLPFFGSFSWRLNPSVNILLGRNGYGKSHFLSILCAILKNDFNKSAALSRINETKNRNLESNQEITVSKPLNQHGRRLEVYLTGNFEQDTEKIEKLTKEISDLKQVTDPEKIREIEDKKNQLSALQNEKEAGKNRSRVEMLKEEIRALQEVTDTGKITSINKKETEIRIEEGLVMLNPGGLHNERGQVPILAIPDMRFVNKSREFTDQSTNELLKGDNYLKNSSYHFIHQEPYESVLQNLLNLLGVTYMEKGQGFSPYLFTIISDLFWKLTGNRFTWNDCTLQADGYRITILTEGDTIPLPIQKISQGTFSVMSIVGLIYIFLSRKYPDITDDSILVKQQAIVIIDEIDAHLHPLWQQKIVSLIRDIFENCQFIITAHSPLVVAGCKEEEVAVMRDIRDSNKLITGFSIYQFREDFIGVSAEDLYAKIFDVEGKDQAYERYVAMQPFISEKIAEKQELEAKKKTSGLTEIEEQRLKKLRDDVYYAGKVKAFADNYQTASDLEDLNIALEVTIDSLRRDLEECRKKNEQDKI